MKKKFEEWIDDFKSSIATYDYYIDFSEVYKNTDKVKIELNILNSLLGSKNIENDFDLLIKKYPEVIKCLPILIAKREMEIPVRDVDKFYVYRFSHQNLSISDYKVFMRKTGLFDLISNHLVGSLVDYVLGVEVGLNSNGRKNRGGHLMENLVEKYIMQTKVEYYKEMYLSEVEAKFNLDLKTLSNNGNTKKRFDFVVRTSNMVYAIETNFYEGQGSKLNETARSYKTLALEARDIPGFTFVWITDGKGWKSAQRNLQETFDVLDTIYNLNDLEKGELFVLFGQKQKI